MIDGEIIFSAGCVPLHTGVGEAWICLAKDGHAYSVVKKTQELILEIICKLKLWRLQAIVRADNDIARRFIQLVGFKEGDLLEMFNPDKTDSYMYSMVIK